MTEQSKEEKYRGMLQQLVSCHFYGVDLKWEYIEGCGLREVDLGLWTKITQEFPELLERN